MFTGIVEGTGICEKLERNAAGGRLYIKAGCIAEGVAAGDSVAVNGCCLTAIAFGDAGGGALGFDLLEETLRRTNLGDLNAGSRVNLERPLRADARLGGHFVQGHIDDTAEVRDATLHGNDLRLECSLPATLARYLAYKGSVAINGVSLTVAEVLADSFLVWLIPHTYEITNLGDLRPGMRVNIETDILAKYTENILLNREK